MLKKNLAIKSSLLHIKMKKPFLYSYFTKSIHLVISIYIIRFILIGIKLNIKKPKNLISYEIILSLIVNKDLIV